MTDDHNTIFAVPVLCVITAALSVASFFLAGYYTDLLIGSPSSTSCLIFIFIPIYAAIAVVAGGVLGFVVGIILYLVGLTTISTRAMLYFAVVLTFIAGLAGYAVVQRYVKFNEPRIIYTEELISKKVIPQKKFETAPILTFENRNQGMNISWNGKKMKLRFPEDQIQVCDNQGKMLINTSLEGYDYVSEISPVEVKLFPDEKSCLAILADLRATSGHAMLLIYSPVGKLIYQEMLERMQYSIKICAEKLPDQPAQGLVVENEDTYFYFASTNKEQEGK